MTPSAALDRVIAWLAPEAGLRRLRARAAFEVALRAYEGARTDRRTQGWRAGGSSANAEIASSLPRLRARSRQLVRDDPYASRAVSVWAGNAVGTGITPAAKAQPLKAWRTAARRLDWYGRVDVYGLMGLTARTMFEGGEVLLLRRRVKPVAPGDSGLRVQVLEGDWLDASRTAAVIGGGYILGGVEFDAGHQVVAYWIYDNHPGDVIPAFKKIASRRVPREDVIHAFEVLRPGQALGVPRFAASLMRFRDLGEYEEAELVRKKIEACFVAFVHGGNSRPLGEQKTDSTTQQRTETLSPGIIEYLGDGEGVTFGSPSSSGGYADYTATQLRAIAAGSGCTYEQLTGDYSKVTYLSARAALIEYRQMVDSWRWLTFVPQVCERLWSWVMDAAYDAGQVRSAEQEVQWTAPRWMWVDPTKDVGAVKEEMRAGLISWHEAVRQLGYDPSVLLDEIEAERADLRKRGITLDVIDAPAKPAAPAGEDTPAGETPAGADTPAGEDTPAGDSTDTVEGGDEDA